MKTKEKLTPWFTNGEKPARPGVYQQMCGFGKELGYQYWSGKRWYSWYEDPETAYKYKKLDRRYGYEHCGEKWRGLAYDPTREKSE